MENGELITSFTINHIKLNPGLYVSTIAGPITTYDVRVRAPRDHKPISIKAAHTLEHLVATYLRTLYTESKEPEDEKRAFRKNVRYWGPMGCLTGFYLLMDGNYDLKDDILPAIKSAFKYCADYEGDVPGATPEGCGSYWMHDLNDAKKVASEYVAYLEANEGNSTIFEYPKK